MPLHGLRSCWCGHRDDQQRRSKRPSISQFGDRVRIEQLTVLNGGSWLTLRRNMDEEGRTGPKSKRAFYRRPCYEPGLHREPPRPKRPSPRLEPDPASPCPPGEIVTLRTGAPLPEPADTGRYMTCLQFFSRGCQSRSLRCQRHRSLFRRRNSIESTTRFVIFMDSFSSCHVATAVVWGTPRAPPKRKHQSP